MIRTSTVAALAALVLLGDVAAVVTVDHRAPTSTVAQPAATPDREPASESLDQQLARVREHVERIRGLQFRTDPLVRQAARAELQADVEAQLSEYTEVDARLDAALLVALGQLPPGSDLRALLITAYGEQVAGYYDPETAELVVGTDDPTKRLGRLDEVTLAHELAHSLVDARVGLPDLEAFEDGREDALSAAQAMVEGDATLLMTQYTEQAMSAIDAVLLAREALAMADAMAAFTALPLALQRALEFPYTEGAAFVQSLHGAGGWAAVDAAYARPPTTTLEILDPTRYGRIQVEDPTPPGAPGPAWTLERTASFGAFDLLLLLDLPGNRPQGAIAGARSLALGWTGGAVTQWTGPEGSAFALHVRHQPSVAMCAALQSWYLEAFPEAVAEPTDASVELATTSPLQSSVVDCDDGEVRIGLAPTVEVANRAIGNGRNGS